jgi:hypothetical protein
LGRFDVFDSLLRFHWQTLPSALILKSAQKPAGGQVFI